MSCALQSDREKRKNRGDRMGMCRTACTERSSLHSWRRDKTASGPTRPEWQLSIPNTYKHVCPASPLCRASGKFWIYISSTFFGRKGMTRKSGNRWRISPHHPWWLWTSRNLWLDLKLAPSKPGREILLRVAFFIWMGFLKISFIKHEAKDNASWDHGTGVITFSVTKEQKILPLLL